MLKSKHMFKKISLSLMLALSTLLFTVAPAVHAQTTWWDQTLQEFGAKVSGGNPNDIFGERYTYAQVKWVIYSLLTIPIGQSLLNCLATNGTNIANFAICVGLTAPGSVRIIGKVDSPILFLAAAIDQVQTSRPASFVGWLANNNLHIIPEAKAQGFGFRTLSIAASLWQVSRNFSYALMTIAIVVLAFMIMFRVKISPQLSITIQSAIPKVAIGLILITFSYAIAGFLIDLAYVVQGIVALMIASATPSLVSNISPIDIFNHMNNGTYGMLSYILSVVWLAFSNMGGIVTGLGATVLNAGLLPFSPILSIIVLLLVLFAALRIFWILLRNYISIIMLVIAAPFYILLGVALPNFGGFGSWFKSFVSTLAIFPVVGIMILFAHFMLWSTIPSESWGATSEIMNAFHFNTNTTKGQAYVQLPTFGSNVQVSFIGFFGSIVVMLAIPSIANSVKSFIASGRAGPIQPEMGFGGTLIGAGAGLAGGAVANRFTTGIELKARNAEKGTLEYLQDLAKTPKGRREAIGYGLGKVTQAGTNLVGSVFGGGGRRK